MLYNAHRPSVVAHAPEVVSARSIEETCNPPACIDLDFSRFFRLSEAVRTRWFKLVGWLVPNLAQLELEGDNNVSDAGRKALGDAKEAVGSEVEITF